jgi:PncC family amidohydrolase
MLSETLTGPAGRIAERLTARGQTLAVAESASGGLISAALLSIPGASRFYRGGVVLYTRENLLAVLGDATDRDPGRRGASEPWARYLAHATKAKHGADWGVSETGASGPDPNRYGDPAGHAWVAVAGPDGREDTEHVLTGIADRAANMEAFAAHALNRLAAQLG